MGEIKNNGIPTPKTKGSMGDIYIDTSTGEQYECVFAYSSHSYCKHGSSSRINRVCLLKNLI